MFKPIVDNITSEMGVPTNYIDISLSMELANKLDVRAVPTIMLMKDGQLIKRYTGIMNKDQFKQFLS
jgi:thioredoxin 1